jgi:hypothetical protein
MSADSLSRGGRGQRQMMARKRAHVQFSCFDKWRVTTSAKAPSKLVKVQKQTILKVERGQTTGSVNKGDKSDDHASWGRSKRFFFLKKEQGKPRVCRTAQPVVRLLQTTSGSAAQVCYSLSLSFSIANYCYIREHEAFFSNFSCLFVCA